MITLTLIALLISLIFIALFAASEAILAATNRVRLRHLLRAQSSNDAGDASTPPGDSADELSGEAQRFIATVTIAANVPMLLAATLTVALATERFDFSPLAAACCAAVALGAVALFQIAPRLLVSQNGFRPPLWVRPARVLVWILRPPVGALMLLGKLILRPLGLARRSPKSGARAETEAGGEIRDLVDDMVESAHKSGAFESGGKELFESIFTFGDTRVHEVMIPRPDILALPAPSTPDTILQAFEESGFSRLPLHEGDVDHIVGILHVNDVLRCISEDQWSFDARGLMRSPMFLPEAQAIDEAFAAMRASRTHLAIVMDEFGGTAGLLTIEDILEELVGEIADEHDRKVEEPLTILDNGSAIADALLHVEDLEEQWNLVLPAGEFDTVGGFVIEQLGRAPVIGDRIEVPGATLTVHAVRGRRPHKIMIAKSDGVTR
jgi:CBS domain containing-hemolysin-like protein